MAFNVQKLFSDVFNPEKNETVLIIIDTPEDKQKMTPEWRLRHQMAFEWHKEIDALGKKRGVEVLPLASYPATFKHNAELPLGEGKPIPLNDALSSATIVMALTEFSASAPLMNWSKSHPDFRCASMPMITKKMEKTALAADYKEVARRCEALKKILEGAEGIDVDFSTGHGCYFDVRYRECLLDDGYLPRNKEGHRLINLPSGETFYAPYEGEKEEPSLTSGELPVMKNGELVVFKVEANTIIEVMGDGKYADEFRKFFALDAARRNIAECAFGTNPEAVVTGNVLEDEKAGFHWAYGRSDHIGGITGVDKFASPANVVHFDIVYAKDSPISVKEAKAKFQGDKTVTVIRNGEYTVF
ncbi:MAG: aminopeptidase [Candidatus Aminicenantes bacterium]|nr:aminopeptidase [Candidatus Aminicenantes bacterium]